MKQAWNDFLRGSNENLCELILKFKKNRSREKQQAFVFGEEEKESLKGSKSLILVSAHVDIKRICCRFGMTFQNRETYGSVY